MDPAENVTGTVGGHIDYNQKNTWALNRGSPTCQCPPETMTLSEFYPFAWPAVVLIIAIVALLAYRSPVSRLLDRLRGLGFKSARWNLQASAAPQPANSAVFPRVSDEAKAIFDPVLLQEQKDLVQREVLEKHHLEGEAREEETHHGSCCNGLVLWLR